MGTIPSTTDAEGKMWFDEGYSAFAGTTELPANNAPTAKIRKPVFAITTGGTATLLAFCSVNKDGDIVLYQWDFGDGTTKTTTGWSVHHSFSRVGNYTITVVDNMDKQDTKASCSVHK